MVMVCIAGRLLVSVFITYSPELVGGNGSLCDGRFNCCSGYKWNRNTEKCIPCEIGFFGVDCARQCVFPSFGKECQLSCNCPEDQCNYEKGCPKGDCGPGYLGDFCDVKCPYPGFGTECQDECLCEQEKCDPVSGCQGRSEGNFMEVVTTPVPKSRMTHNITVSLRHDADVSRGFSSRDTSSVLSTTPDMPKETSIQGDTASMWKTLNGKERGMVISITTLGLLFLILTALYIWVSHRLRVETNNRRKTTEDLDENSAV
ncbi:multiple epidermal growth factor-like domains protein 10 [Ostrea edulis]|uniref:multiple epidermal growth factor-like domains protein 10 n=1 Tax=Ostrea edulis TaxID=37623 RepID=UPI0024AEAF07|nr:multiple epidermal growth factor-like domains protein 10 [Ostrea edulis]